MEQARQRSLPAVVDLIEQIPGRAIGNALETNKILFLQLVQIRDGIQHAAGDQPLDPIFPQAHDAHRPVRRAMSERTSALCRTEQSARAATCRLAFFAQHI